MRDGLIPNLFPEGDQRRPLPHRRCDAVVLPRDRSLRDGHRRHGHAARSAASLDDIVASPSRRHAVRHPHGSRRPADAGRPGLAAHLDGREGRATGSSRRGAASPSRSTRSGSTRSASSAMAGTGARSADRLSSRRWPLATSVVQPALLVRARRLSLRHRRRRSRRRSRVPAEPDLRWRSTIRSSTSALGSGGRRGRANGCSRRFGLRTLDPHHPISRRSISAICARAMRRITRARCGRG